MFAKDDLHEIFSYDLMSCLGDCETDWFEFEENCYKAFEERMNYKTAKEHCKSLGSELTNIRTANENALLKKLGNSKYLWTAVQKICVNCTQTEAGYVNWSPGQPSGVSSCIAMNPNGHWRDFDCEYMFALVCKKGRLKISALALVSRFHLRFHIFTFI